MKTIATAIAFATAAVLLAPTAAHAEDPTRVLIVGDSVTHGYAGDYTWRYFSWLGLQQTGASVDFVGHRTGTNGGDGGAALEGPYADAGFDTNHSARWGMAMRDLLDAPDATSPAIDDLVSAHSPDVIVEQLGVNDFVRENMTAESMFGQVRRFVADARSVKPEVDVVLGSIPQTWIREVGAYNAGLPGLAAELSTSGSRVTTTPVAAFTNGVDTYDFAHPTTDGQRKIASAISVGLESLGIGRAITMPAPAIPGPNDPQPAEVAPTTTPEAVPTTAPPEAASSVPGTPAAEIVAPGSPRKVKAVDRGARTVVKWRVVQDADRYVVQCGRVSKATPSSRTAIRSAAKRCKVRAVNSDGASPWVPAKVRPSR